MKEKTILFGKNRTLVGVVTSEELFAVSQGGRVGFLLLNAGLIHHVGPSRIYVKLARALAGLGCVVMRFDMSGIGDSQVSQETGTREEMVLQEIQEAMDCLQRDHGIDYFIPVGICSGAAFAFRLAEMDSRVQKAVLINPEVPRSEHTYNMSYFEYYTKRALFKKSSWLKLVTVKSDFKLIWQSISLKFKRLLIPRYVEKLETTGLVEQLQKTLKILKDKKVDLLFIYSNNEIGYQYLKELMGMHFLALEEAGLLQFRVLTETDHNITPVKSQKKVIDIISTWVKDKCKYIDEIEI